MKNIMMFWKSSQSIGLMKLAYNNQLMHIWAIFQWYKEQRGIIQNNDLVHKTGSQACVWSIRYKMKYAFYERGVWDVLEIKKIS